MHMWNCQSIRFFDMMMCLIKWIKKKYCNCVSCSLSLSHSHFFSPTFVHFLSNRFFFDPIIAFVLLLFYFFSPSKYVIFCFVLFRFVLILILYFKHSNCDEAWKAKTKSTKERMKKLWRAGKNLNKLKTCWQLPNSRICFTVKHIASIIGEYSKQKLAVFFFLDSLLFFCWHSMYVVHYKMNHLTDKTKN